MSATTAVRKKIAPAPLTIAPAVIAPAPPTLSTTTTPSSAGVAPVKPIVTTPQGISPTLVATSVQATHPPMKPLQPIAAQPKIQPAPIQPAQSPIPKPAPTPTTHTFQNIQAMPMPNFPVAPPIQTIAPAQILSGAGQTQAQKQLRTPKSKTTQQTQATAQKPRKQKQTKRAVKRATPAATTTQPILPRPAKGRTKITAEEIQLVQSLIERCLQLYMNQTEVITALHLQANIEPSFTSLVWLKLEEQNPDFFKAYHIRLKIKEQITAFNYLVSQQAQLMHKAGTFVPGLNQGVNTSPQPAGSPLTGSPQTMPFGAPYAPLPQLASLQALQTSASPGLSASHPTPIAPRVPQTTCSPTLNSNGLGGSFTSLPEMNFNFDSSSPPSSGFGEEEKDDTPITEDIDTNQFFLS